MKVPKEFTNQFNLYRDQKIQPGAIPISRRVLFHLASEHFGDLDTSEALLAVLNDPRQLEIASDMLSDLVQYIMEYEKGRLPADDELAVVLFKKICKHSARTDLIFYPANVVGRELTIEEVVKAAETGVL